MSTRVNEEDPPAPARAQEPRGVSGAPTFVYRKGLLHCEGVSLEDLYRAVGPAYAYSARRLRENAQRTLKAFARAETLVAYAVKANTNPALLRLFYELGLGFETSSGAELAIALEAGAAPAHVVVNGNARSESELEQVAASGAYLVSVDSAEEAQRLEAAAARLASAGRLRAPVRAALRFNPDIDPHVHPDLATGIGESKFGVPPDIVIDWYAHPERTPHLKWVGLHVHVGSQVLEVDPLLDTLGECVDLIERVRALGASLSVLNLGGGFGIDYDGKGGLALERFADAACLVAAGQGLRLVVEPGRYLVADACAIVGRVLFVKRTGRTFAVTELAMNDLIRPTLYDAYHEIVPVRQPPALGAGGTSGALMDVVGPICESGDYLAKGRRLPALAPGELIAVTGAGAYGYTMASNYNGRGRLPEALVDGERVRLIRRGETWKDIVRLATDLSVDLTSARVQEVEEPARPRAASPKRETSGRETAGRETAARETAARETVTRSGHWKPPEARPASSVAAAIAEGLRSRRRGGPAKDSSGSKTGARATKKGSSTKSKR